MGSSSLQEVVEDLHILVREVQGRRTDLAAALATVAEQDLCRQLLRGISGMTEDVQEGHHLGVHLKLL